MKLDSQEINGFVAVKEIQRHPVNEKLIHVDFFIIDQDSGKMRLPMMLNFYNDRASPGIKLGGFLKITSRAIEVYVENVSKLRPWLGVNMEGLQQKENINLTHVHFPEGITPVRKSITVATLMPSKGGGS
jgi:large subunit ribosomal protein L25